MHTLLLILWITAIALIISGAVIAIITLRRAQSAHISQTNQASGE